MRHLSENRSLREVAKMELMVLTATPLDGEVSATMLVMT